MTDTNEPREQLREIVARRRAGPATYRADDTRLLVEALARVERARDAEALPSVIDVWCSRPKSHSVLERLGGIASDLRRWRCEKPMAVALADHASFDRFRAAFDPEMLAGAEGVAFAAAILQGFSFVATGHRDGSLSDPKFAYQPVAEALSRPEWIRLLASLRDHADLGDAAWAALRVVPKELVPAMRSAEAGALARPRGDALSRYRAGEREAAWQSMQDLGPLGPDAREEARAVATEMMKIARANAEAIVEVLEVAGYPFAREPLANPEAGRALLRKLAHVAGGPPPVSLEVFWEIVGGIDLCREETEDVCELDVDLRTFLVSNALMVSSLEDAWWSVDEWLDSRETPYVDLDLSADELHKEWTSGGPPYAIRVPSAHADGRVLREPHRLDLVPYLRLNFEHCGFLGYEYDLQAVPYRCLVERVKHRLQPF